MTDIPGMTLYARIRPNYKTVPGYTAVPGIWHIYEYSSIEKVKIVVLLCSGIPVYPWYTSY